jgi:hypothetical protein
MPERGSASPATEVSGAPNVIARLVDLDAGLFAFSISGATQWQGRAAGLGVPAVHVSSAHSAKERAVEITTPGGEPGAWLGGSSGTLLVRSPAGGGSALVTAYLGHASSAAPLELAIRRLDAAPEQPVQTVTFGAEAEATASPGVGLEIVLHIRGRGHVYFVDPDWAGRLEPGSWIEALTILPRHSAAAAAIEYKGLSASGVETSWLPSGAVCGTIGRNIPLLGFAVRQKAGTTGVRFDCEYSGYFQSGAVSGPTRNGAPCLSSTSNDPLEGLQLRIVERPAGP